MWHRILQGLSPSKPHIDPRGEHYWGRYATQPSMKLVSLRWHIVLARLLTGTGTSSRRSYSIAALRGCSHELQCVPES